jgi:glycosyltransferase involved in cell wall biosynthesis
VPAHDPPALAQALVELLSDDELRASMSAASVARHGERFGLERMVRETSALYDDVIATAR